ncbi:hypothetical protein Mapa_015647 [Marchantia paleacea]|nr:hypothetical protein Mapa_015647 [Marchantia paleacea]
MPELEPFMQAGISHAKEMGRAETTPVRNGVDSDSCSESDLEFKEDCKEVIPPEREIPSVLNVLSQVLERLVARNERYAGATYTTSTLNSRKLTAFHGLRAPGISIGKYLERIFKYTNCSPSCFVVGYVYIDRLIHRQPDLPVTSLNVHRLLVTSVMVATKMLDDVHFNNSFFARVGGVSVVELNRLELELLFRLDFRLLVTMNVFESYCSHLEKEALRDETRIDRSLPIPSPAFRSPAQSPHPTPKGKRLSATLSGTYDRAAVHALISRQFAESPSR